MIVGVSMVKDELDVIRHVVLHMLEQCDAVIVADNGSTDGTRAALDELAVERPALTVVDDPEVGYYQSRKMSELAARAAARGATWVVPFDADEWWLSRFGRIADVLASLPERESVAHAPLFDHVATGADDPAELNPFARIQWRRKKPVPFPKVACRPVMPVWIHQGNHGADFGAPTPNPVLEVRHFPYRSVEQMVRKARNGAAAYAATDLPPDAGKHWRDYGALLDGGGPDAIAKVFHRWFYVASPRNPPLVHEPVS